MNNDYKKLILKYAAIIAKGDEASQTEKEQLSLIEDQVHLTKESILRQATELGLANLRK